MTFLKNSFIFYYPKIISGSSEYCLSVIGILGGKSLRNLSWLKSAELKTFEWVWFGDFVIWFYDFSWLGSSMNEFILEIECI